METKRCSKCKTEYLATTKYFYRTKRLKCGLNTWCKQCSKEYDKIYKIKYNAEHDRTEYFKKYGQKNKERIKKYNKEYVVKNKEKVTEYKKQWIKENPDKRSLINKKAHKKYYEKYPERKKESDKRYVLTERGQQVRKVIKERYRTKVKNLSATLTLNEWRECLNHFEEKCAYCGRKVKKLVMEHFVPVSKEGAFVKSNIIPACGTCNHRKINKDFDEWYPEQEFYDKEKEVKILDYIEVM